MRTIQQLIHLSVSFLFLSTTTFSTNHYVDKNASGQNNGTSWANAWKNFSNINWSLIQPGDYIYISGGTDSTVYYETLEPACSGTASNYVTIIAGKYSPSPSGHSGKVIINGGNYSRYGIAFFDQGGNKPSYLIVKGIETRSVNKGVYANFDVQHKCLVLDSLGLYGFSEGGIRFETGETGYQNIDSLFIQNCRIVSPNYIDGESDGIQLKGTSRNFIHNNYIRIPNQQPTAHVDALQGYLCNGFVITNNIFINDSVYSTEGGGIPIILGSEGSNPVIIYNNFCYMGGVWYSGGNWAGTLMTRWYDHNPMPPTWIIHNSVVSNGPRVRGVWLEFATPTNTVVVNNIIAQFSTTTNGVISTFDNSTGSALRVDNIRHNLFYRSWSNDVTFAGNVTGNGRTGTPTGWADWVNNYGGTGVKGNPNFVNHFGYEPDQGLLDGEIGSNSAGINQGENAESLLNYLNTTYGLNGRLKWEDINGNPRDNTPDIGAYKYISGGGGGNYPPNQPSNPNPSNGATNQQLNLTLSWTCADPDGDPLTYDVYFGTNSNPPIVSTNQSSTIFNTGLLTNSTTYYWKIVAKDNQGHSTSGLVWNFTTETAIVNNPPYPPSNPNPGNGATNQPINLSLTWNSTDPDGDPLTFDVYFGNNDEPPLVSTNQSNASFNPGTLNSNTIYYWRIVAKDNQGHSTSGLVWNFSTLYIDQTPPDLVNAELQDSIHLHVWFSEPLEQASAQNISNYSINNGVQVLGASLSGSGVTLLTSVHTTGVYTLTVINVKDLAGNQITPPNNTYQYEYSSSLAERVNLELKVFLDGPYSNNSMTTYLSNNSMIPLTQPYSVSPWNYYGSETVTGLPQNTVDWILLELRTNTSASSVVSRRAAFLRSDGIAVELNGSNKISFPGVQDGYYFVVVYHRNHLAIMTKNAIQLSETSSLYDFTTSQNKAYGNQPMKSLYGGKYGLYAADGNANGNVNNSDNSSVWRPENGTVGYKEGDFDLNGGVNIVDKNAKWKINKGKISYVPTN